MQLFTSFRQKITSLPKLYKLIAGLILTILVIVTAVFAITKIIKKEKISFTPPPAKWDKLKLDSSYTPLYILSPTTTRKFGVISQEVYSLKTKNPTDKETLQSNLTSDKPIKIDQKGPNEYLITPTTSLNPEETMSLSIKDNPDYSWTFQAAPRFKIVGNLPANESKNVPLNAGIEIIFNNDSYELKENNVEISPEVKFRIEKRDERTAIVPLTTFKPKTVYTVTIKKGLSLFSGNNSLEKDHTFSFQTADMPESKPRFSVADDFQEIFPDEPLITKVYSYNFDVNQSINAKVYKFSNRTDFINSRETLDKVKSTWAEYYAETDPIDTSKLSEVLSADLKIQTTQGNERSLQYLQLPQNLDAGFYLVQFRFNDSKMEQVWVESTPLPTYVSVGKDQTAIWVNSAKGEDINPATITILGTGTTYSTNGQGWAAFPTPSIFFDGKSRHYILVTSQDGQEIVLPVNNLNGNLTPNSTSSSDYWSYLYHERNLYKPNDTVYFWGIAKNKDTGGAPGSIDIYLEDKLNQTVTPASDGTYFGQIKLQNIDIGYKYISARMGQVTLSDSYFNVSDYTKPELKIEVTSNKKAVYAGDKVDFKARVTFFDGTAAPNSKLYLTSYSGGQVDNSERTADKNGEIDFTYTTTPRQGSGYEGVTVSAVKSGDHPSDGMGSVYVYRSALQMELDQNQNKEKAELSGVINTLDLDLINNKGLSSPISGVAKNQKVELVLTKTWYEQVQNGTYYDFVEKVTRPSYTYKMHEETADKKEVRTDGEGKFNYSFNMEMNKSYRVELKTTDSEGRLEEKTTHFYYSTYQEEYGQQASKAYMNIDKPKNLYSKGETVNLTVEKNGNRYQKTDKSKFLFILAQRGRQEIFVRDNPDLSFVFEDRYAPEVYVGTIIFNGRVYEEVKSSCKNGWVCGWYDYYNNDYFFDPLVIRYQNEDSELDLSILPNKTKYQPGETASVKVRVTKNGNTVEGANVQLTLVDEALALIGGVNEPNILPELYKQSPNLIYYNYYSHRPVLPDAPQAERGGGGGDRDLFKDTAFFGTAVSGSDGIATFTVKLPDNITNWLTYAQAFTQQIDAGQVKSSIIATKDFFVTSHFPRVVTVNDKPVVAVSVFGNALNKNVKLPITVKVSKDGTELKSASVSTEAFKESYASMPQLQSGTYSVTSSGTYNNLEDGITLPFQAITSRLEFKLQQNKILEKGQTLNSFDNVKAMSDKPIKLVISDEGKGKYYYNLYKYCWGGSNRLEKRMSSIKASQILTARFKDRDCYTPSPNDLTVFQASDGGLRPVEWAESDLETTLWATYIDPSQFDKEALIRYFEREAFFNSTASQIEKEIYKNWGLTLLGKPKINELNSLSVRATTYREKVLVALALYSAGNKERSRQMYFNILSDYAYTNKPYLRIEADQNKRDYDIFALDTSYALLLGTLNNEVHSNEFSTYLNDFGADATKVITDVANISYLDKVLSELPDKDTVISFKTARQNLTRNITKDGILNLKLTSSEVNKFDLKVLDGKIDALVSYFVHPDSFDALPADDRIKFERKVTRVAGDAGGYKLGDILKVELKYDFDDKAPLGCYDLTDYIPSGMAFVENPGNFDLSIGQVNYMYTTGQNIVKGCAYNSRWPQMWGRQRIDRSVYFVRITAVGKFVKEPSTIQYQNDPSIFQKTPQEYVTVER